MRDTGLSWETQLQTQSSDVVHSFSEFLKNSSRGDADDFRSQNTSVVINSQEFHTILEWSDVEFLQQGRGIVGDCFSFFADVDILDDFDLTLVDLGGDL